MEQKDWSGGRVFIEFSSDERAYEIFHEPASGGRYGGGL